MKIIAVGRISTKNQVTLPTEIRELFHTEVGDRIIFRLNDRNEVVMDVVKKTSARELLGSLNRTVSETEDTVRVHTDSGEDDLK